MSDTKIVLIVLAILFFVLITVYAVRYTGTMQTTNNGIKEIRPFGKKQKALAIIGTGFWTFYFISMVVRW